MKYIIVSVPGICMNYNYFNTEIVSDTMTTYCIDQAGTSIYTGIPSLWHSIFKSY